MLLRAVALLPPTGALVGLGVAAHAIAQHDYLHQGLWRTALSAAGRWAILGAIAGVGAACLTIGLLAVWRRAIQRQSLFNPRPRLRGPVALGAVTLALAGGLWLSGAVARGQARAEARARGVNVILIGLDTVRADRTTILSPDQYQRDLTPNLRRYLKPRATVFTRATCQAPWTLPSFASMFTGLYPAQHGAQHLTSKLPKNRLTIAELLREAGYRTLGVVSCVFVTRAAGMGQGFDILDESQVLGHQPITSEELTDRAIALLESNRGEPFFLFAHYFDPHWAYRDHAAYSFADGYRGWVTDPAFELDQSEFRIRYRALGPQQIRSSPLTHKDQSYLSDLYDEDLAYTDEQVGRLLEYIETRGLWDSTMVIVVADHGEEIFDRGFLGHERTLYEELVHVPLAVTVPGEQSAVSDRPVEARALFGTIADWTGVRLPPGATPPALGGDAEPASFVRSATYTVHPDPLRGTVARNWITCLADDRWKLVKAHGSGRTALFDLRDDPGELHDCRAEHPDKTREMQRLLEAIDVEVQSAGPAGGAPQIGEEQRRRLESLGYL